MMLKIAVTAVALACAGSAIGAADDLAKRPPTDQLGHASNAHGGSTAAPGSQGAVVPEDSAPPALGPPLAATGAAPTAAPADARGSANRR